MANIRAELRFLSATGVADPLEAYHPEPPFGFCVLAIVGPLGAPGQESFDFMVCTPDWFALEHLRVKNRTMEAATLHDSSHRDLRCTNSTDTFPSYINDK